MEGKLEDVKQFAPFGAVQVFQPFPTFLYAKKEVAIEVLKIVKLIWQIRQVDDCSLLPGDDVCGYVGMMEMPRCVLFALFTRSPASTVEGSPPVGRKICMQSTIHLGERLAG